MSFSVLRCSFFILHCFRSLFAGLKLVAGNVPPLSGASSSREVFERRNKLFAVPRLGWVPRQEGARPSSRRYVAVATSRSATAITTWSREVSTEGGCHTPDGTVLPPGGKFFPGRTAALRPEARRERRRARETSYLMVSLQPPRSRHMACTRELMVWVSRGRGYPGSMVVVTID